MKHKPEIPKNYPGDDPTGFFTTFDILKGFKWKRGLLKNWIEEGYIKPLYQVEDKRGKKSYFAGYQLYTIKLFKHLLDMGISRQYASTFLKLFEAEFIKKGKSKEIDFVVFELRDRQVKKVTAFSNSDGIQFSNIKEDSNDIYVLNFKKIVKEVDEIS
jgi:hypothetical protein